MRLKELRAERGLNQTELARELGTTQSNISGWETGKWEADNTALQLNEPAPSFIPNN